MERFVLGMDRMAFLHVAFCFLHGAFFRPSRSGCPFDRLVSGIDRRVFKSDRLVLRIDRRVSQTDRLGL